MDTLDMTALLGHDGPCAATGRGKVENQMSFEFNADDWIAGMDEPAVEPPAAEPAPSVEIDTSTWLAPMEQPAPEAPAPSVEIDTSTWLAPMEQPAPDAPAPSVEIDTSTWLAPMEQPAPEAPAPSVEIDTSTWLAPMEQPPAPAAPSDEPDTSAWLAPMEPAPEPIETRFEPGAAPGVDGPPSDIVDPAAWIDEIGTPQATMGPAIAAGLEISDDPVVHSELLSLLQHENELSSRTTSPNPLIEADLALERLRERQGLDNV